MSNDPYPYFVKYELKFEFNNPTDVFMTPVYFTLIMVLLVSCGCKKLSIRSHYAFLLLMTIGIIIGVVASWTPVESRFISRVHVIPPLITLFCTPSILLSKGISLNVHTLQKCWSQIVLISVVMFVCQINILGFTAYELEHTGIQVEPETRSIQSTCTGILFGAITSAIDSYVATEMEGTQSANSRALIPVVKGESIASLLYTFVTYKLVEQLMEPTEIVDDLTTYRSLMILFLNLLLGFWLGLFSGIILTSALRCLKLDETSEMIIVIAIAHVITCLALVIPYGASYITVIVYSFYVQRKLVFKDTTVTALNWLIHVIQSLLSFWMGIVIGHDFTIRYDYERIHTYWMPVFYYAATYGTRTFMYFFLKPILQLMGYGMTWREVAIATLSGIKEIVLILPLCFCFTQTNFFVDVYAIHSRMFNNFVILCALSYFINGLFFPYAMKALGFKDVPLSRKINMYRAVQFIAATRVRTMENLKTELQTSDANWSVVDKSTAVSNPFQNDALDQYEQRSSDDIMEKSNIDYENYVSGNISQLTQDSPLRREILERILKISKVICMKQYESKLISHDVMRRVINAIDLCADQRERVFKISAIRNSWIPDKILLLLKNKSALFLKPVPKTEYYKPHNKIRDRVYHIVQRPAYDTIIFVILLTHFASSLGHIGDEYSQYQTRLGVHIVLITTIGVSAYFLDIILKITAFGFHTFFSSNVYKLDIFSTVLSPLEIFIPFTTMATPFKNLLLIVCTVGHLLVLLRCIIYGFLSLRQIAGASITIIVENYILKQLLFGYQVGRTYMTIIDEIQQRMLQIVDNEFFLNDINDILESQRLELSEELGLLQIDFPIVAITAKTQLAMLTVIQEMKWTIGNLADNGLIDKTEQQMLMSDLNKRQSECMKDKFISPRLPQSFIEDISWLEGEEMMAKFLLSKTQILSFLSDEFLIYRGERPKGLYILAAGLVKTFYEPSVYTIDLSEKYGQLPNCDFFIHLNFTTKQDDIVVPGNVFGEIGLLTAQPYDYSAIAFAGCQIYFISTEWVRRSMQFQSDASTSLDSRIWKSIAQHIALLITSQISVSGSISGNEIKRSLRRGFVPNLQYINSIPYSELIRDIYLIQGIAYDVKFGSKYVAPCYIPPSVKLLYLSDVYDMDDSARRAKRNSNKNDLSRVKIVLFIVPAEGVQEWEIMNELMQSFTLSGVVRAAQKSHIKLYKGNEDPNAMSWVEFRTWSDESLIKSAPRSRVHQSKTANEIETMTADIMRQRMYPSVSRASTSSFAQKQPEVKVEKDDETVIVTRRRKEAENKEESERVNSSKLEENQEESKEQDDKELISNNNPDEISDHGQSEDFSTFRNRNSSDEIEDIGQSEDNQSTLRNRNVR